MSASDTPMTDAIARHHDTIYQGHEIGAIYALARQLERELAAAKDALANCEFDRDGWRQRAADYQAERDALRDDAERYQFLVLNARAKAVGRHHELWFRTFLVLGPWTDTKAVADAAIDRERAK